MMWKVNDFAWINKKYARLITLIKWTIKFPAQVNYYLIKWTVYFPAQIFVFISHHYNLIFNNIGIIILNAYLLCCRKHIIPRSSITYYWKCVNQCRKHGVQCRNILSSAETCNPGPVTCYTFIQCRTRYMVQITCCAVRKTCYPMPEICFRL